MNAGENRPTGLHERYGHVDTEHAIVDCAGFDEEMELRTLILERVAALEPIGRRALAARLHLAEREVRAAAEALKRAGCLTQSASGMELTPQGQSLVEGGADGQQRAADIIGHRIVALADAGRRAGSASSTATRTSIPG